MCCYCDTWHIMPGGLLPSASQQVCVPAPRPGPGTTPPHMYLPGHCLLLRLQLSTCLGLNKWRYILYTLHCSKLELRFLWLWCFVVIYLIQCQWRIDVIYGLICKILIQCSNFFWFYPVWMSECVFTVSISLFEVSISGKMS